MGQRICPRQLAKGQRYFASHRLAARPLTPALPPEAGERESRAERLNSPIRTTQTALPCGSRRAGQVLSPDRQAADAFAGGGEDRVGDGGRNDGGAGFADAAPFLAAGQREINLRLRRFL